MYLPKRRFHSPVEHQWRTIPAEIVNGLKLLTISAERLTTDVPLGSKYVSIPYMTYLSKNVRQHQKVVQTKNNKHTYLIRHSYQIRSDK